MGVTGLWYILSELCERKNIKDLSGKKIAVDLSGWVVQAFQCKGLNEVKNPHLRNLFYRVSGLLLNGVHPIFVMEGKVPDLKQATFKKRNYQGNSSADNVSRSQFDRVLNQCHELLKSLGVPCIKSSGEAEAFCAFLCAKGVVDGVITNDNDAFLYGADTVYRDFSIDTKDPHINEYSLNSSKNKLPLSQKNLIALALLLGCDYAKGVPGIGKEAALKLFKELNGCDLLQRFQEWQQKSESELFPGYETDIKKKDAHCKRCSHLGSSTKHKKEGCSMCDSKITCYITDSRNPCTCTWHKNFEAREKQKHEYKVYTAAKSIPEFPNIEVIEEYLNFKDKLPDENALIWQCPDLKQFQDKAYHFLSWTFQHSFEKCFPIITSWQQFMLSKRSQIDKIILLYKPIVILKTCTVKGEDCLKVQWVSVGGDESSEKDKENFLTVEFEERFRNSYPKIVEEYHDSIEKAKPQPKSKSKKRVKMPDNRKMNSMMAERKETSESDTPLGQKLNLNVSSNIWKPASRSQQTIEDKENLRRKVQAVLNKLTFQKFKILLSQLKKLNIDSSETMDLVVELIYENAIYEPYFCILYANLCKQLAVKMPFAAQYDDHLNFCTLLLSKCIRGFDEKFCSFKENRNLQPLDNEENVKLKTRWFANMRFMGELFKFKMIQTSVILSCADILLKQEDEDSLECFCWLMKTAGKELENFKGLPKESPVDEYFAQIQKIIDSRLTSTRIRFLLQDIIDLKESNWIPRRIENRPRTIDEIRKEAALEAQKQMQMYHKMVSSNTSACNDQVNAACYNSCNCDSDNSTSAESTKVNHSATSIPESETPSEVKNLLLAHGWKGKKKNYHKRKSQNNRNHSENKNLPKDSPSKPEL